MIRILRLAGWIAGIGATTLACLALSLQVDSVSTLAGRWLTNVLSGPDLRLSVDRVEGSWIRSLRVTNLTISSFPAVSGSQRRTGAPGPGPEPGSWPLSPGWEISVDSLKVGYRLISLLSRTLALTEVDGDGVRVRVHLAPPDPSGAYRDQTSPEENDRQGWRISGERLGIRGGAITLRQLGGEKGSHSEGSAGLPEEELREPDEWALDRINVLARNVEMGGGFSLQVDSLQGRLLPLAEGGPEGRILAVGGYGASGLRLDTLLFSTHRSHLEARGRIPIPLPLPPAEGLELRLSAQPLHLHDLRPFLPESLPDTLEIQVLGEAASREGSTTLDLRANTSGSGRLEVRSTLSGGGIGTESSALLQVRKLDLALLGVGPPGREVDLTLEARADSLAGSWEGTWSGTTPGVSLEGTGSLAFEARPRWKLDGGGSWQVQAGAPSIPTLDSTGLTFSLRGSGEGTSPGSMTASGGLRMESGSFGQGLARDLSLTFQVEEGRGELGLTGEVGKGDLQGSGTLEVGELPDLRASASLHLLEAEIRGISLDSAGVTLVARGRELDMDGGLLLGDSAAARWQGTAAFPTGEGPRVVLDSLSFAGLDPRSLMASPDSSSLPPSRLSGKLWGEGVISEEGWEVEAFLQLDPSRVGGEGIEEALLEGRADEKGGSLSLEMRTAGGTATGKVRVAAWEPRWEVRVPEIRFQGLNLGRLLDREGEATRVTGRLRGKFHGGEPSEMAGELTVVLDSAMVLGKKVSPASLEARLQEGRATARLDLVAGSARLEVEGEAGIVDSPISYRLQGQVREEADDRILSAELGLQGEGIDPDSLDHGDPSGQ